MRWVRIGLVVLGVLAGVVVAAGAALYLGGGKALAWALEHPVAGMLGREVRVGGAEVHWGAPTRIVLTDLHVANPPWASEKEMLAAKRVELEVFLRTLVFGPTRMPRLALEGTHLDLETSDKGDANWRFAGAAAAPKKRTQYPYLHRLEAKDSDLRFRNGATGAETALGIAALGMQTQDPASPIELKLDGSFQQKPLKLAGSVGPLEALRDASKPYPVKLQGQLDEAQLQAEGTIGEPLDFDGLDLRLRLGGQHLAEILELFGLPLPTLPDFRGTAEVKGGKGKWRLDAVSLALGKSDLEGGIEIDTTPKVPKIVGNFTGRRINVADFEGLAGVKPPTSSAPKPPPDPEGRVLPGNRIAIEKLPGIDLRIAIYATRVDAVAGIPLDRVLMDVAIEKGALVLKPLQFATAAGDVTLEARYTPFTDSGPPRLSARLDIRHVDLHRLLGGPQMPEIVRHTAGIVGGFARLETTGTSIRDFLGRMDGDVGIFMENGRVSDLLQRLAPIDVLEALGVWLSGDEGVPINCLVSRFDVKRGIATATTLLLDSADTAIVGSGNANFADETLTMTLKPRNKSITVVSLRTPVDISGTFKKPDIAIEKAGLVARLGAAIGLGAVFPPAALLPLVDTGLGENNACGKAYAQQNPPGDPAPKNPPAASGSSRP